MEYIIYTDESDRRGKFYSNFYGGILVRSSDLLEVCHILEKTKEESNLFGEVKWQKVTEQYLEKYLSLMDIVFDLLEKDKIKVRIMFTQNATMPVALTSEHREMEYHLLYYQFIKHSFGLIYSNPTDEIIGIRINIDLMPDTKEKNEQFKSYLVALNSSPQFKNTKIYIQPDQIAEVDSKKHVLLQCMDVILGGMSFRLNDKHLEKNPETNRRGKRTIAKEKLYKHINKRIRALRPNFNIGITTGDDGEKSNRWNFPYRHWSFESYDSVRDVEQTKAKLRKGED
jgi:hypothetical protein